jgi:hypothetical protein
MAIGVVQKAQSPSGATGSLTIGQNTKAGNRVFVFVSQSASVAAPTVEDSVGGSTGWVLSATKALGAASANSLWMAEKVVVAGQEFAIVKFTAGAGGIAQGLWAIELSGASGTVDVSVVVNNTGNVKTVTSPAVSTSDSGDIVLAAVGAVNAALAATSWTGTGPLTPAATEATRCLGGYYLPGSTLSGATVTASWETSRQVGMLVVTIKPTIETFSGPLLGSVALGQQLSGAKTGSGALAQVPRLAGSIAGQRASSGALSQSLAPRASIAASKGTGGALSQRHAAAQSLSARRLSAGALSQQAAMAGALAGLRSAQGALSQAVSVAGAPVPGAKTARGSVSQPVTATASLAGTRATGAAQSQTVALGGLLSGFGARAGAVSQSTRVVLLLAGRQVRPVPFGTARTVLTVSFPASTVVAPTADASSTVAAVARVSTTVIPT